MSTVTKRALAASLKKLLNEKSLDSVTVVDIALDCGVNRQTFYYHFRGMQGLIEWIFDSEAAEALDGKKTYESWNQGFLQILDYVVENKTFVYRTYHSSSLEHLVHYLHNETYKLLYGVIEEKGRGLRVSQEDKKFIADFYKYAFVGIVLDWIGSGLMEKPERIIQRLGTMIRGDVISALERFSEQVN